jgi:hypothetical protein
MTFLDLYRLWRAAACLLIVIAITLCRFPGLAKVMHLQFDRRDGLGTVQLFSDV